MLVMTAGVAFALWVLAELRKPRPSFQPSGAGWIFWAGLVLVVLQTIPLPPAVLRIITPQTQGLLSFWESVPDWWGQRGWCYVSLTPWETCYSLILFVAYGVLFYVSIQVLRERSDIFGLLEWIAVAGVSAAVLAWVQLGVGTDKFLGIFEYPFRKASEYLTGSFTTKNHFGHFLVLTLGPLLLVVCRASAVAHSKSRTSFAGLEVNPQVLMLGSLFGLGLLLLSILGSLSRGAILASAIAGIFFTLTALRAKALRPLVAISLLMVSLVAGVVVVAFQGEEFFRRVETLTSGVWEQIDHRAARRTIWSTVIRALPDFAPLGAGVGSLREVYPIYLTRHDFPRYFTHAESGYLQIALEVGFPGTVLLVIGLGTAGAWVLTGWLRAKDRDLVLATGAVGASLLASMFHSLFDFVWYIPGCMVLTVVLTACACRLAQLASGRDSVPPRAVSRMTLVASLIGLFAFGGWACFWTVRAALAAGYWDQYLLSQRNALAGPEDISGCQSPDIPAQEREDFSAGQTPEVVLGTERSPVGQQGRNADHLELDLTGSVSGHEGETTSDSSASSAGEGLGLVAPGKSVGRAPAPSRRLEERSDPAEQKSQEDPVTFRIARSKSLINILEHVLFYDPYHSRAHLELAACYLELFEYEQSRSENAVPLSQIREVSLSAPFASEEERQAWISRVLGSRRIYLIRARDHALDALHLCPLLGEGYAILATLDFLAPQRRPSAEELLAQALRVRPKDGTILFQAGQMAVLRGDLEEGLRFWQQAFDCGTVYQQRILRILVGKIYPTEPAHELGFLLDVFRPELPALQKLHEYYEPLLRDEDLRVLRETIAASAWQEAESSKGLRSAELWLVAADMHRKLGRHDLRIRALQNALAQVPNSYRVRYLLAEALVAERRYREAEMHFLWCLYRNRTNETLKAKVRWLRQQLAKESAGS
jgi:tetratricopeptide (TPR) repeat protein